MHHIDLLLLNTWIKKVSVIIKRATITVESNYNSV